MDRRPPALLFPLVGCVAVAERVQQRRDEGEAWSPGFDALNCLGGLLGGEVRLAEERAGSAPEPPQGRAPTARAAIEATLRMTELDAIDDLTRSAALELSAIGARRLAHASECRGLARIGHGAVGVIGVLASCLLVINAGLVRGYAAASLLPSDSSNSGPEALPSSDPGRLTAGHESAD